LHSRLDIEHSELVTGSDPWGRQSVEVDLGFWSVPYLTGARLRGTQTVTTTCSSGEGGAPPNSHRLLGGLQHAFQHEYLLLKRHYALLWRRHGLGRLFAIRFTRFDWRIQEGLRPNVQRVYKLRRRVIRSATSEVVLRIGRNYCNELRNLEVSWEARDLGLPSYLYHWRRAVNGGVRLSSRVVTRHGV